MSNKRHHLAEEAPDVEEMGTQDEDNDIIPTSHRRKDHQEITNQTTYTLEEVAEMMGVTRERVRQIQQKALMKIRRKLNREGKNLDDFLPD